MTPSRETRGQTATTARAACTVCHRRKVRCDAHEVGTPCTNCSKHGSRRDNCRIHEKGKRPQRRSQRTPLAKQIDVRTLEGNEVAQKSKSVGQKSPSSATNASLDELGFSILDASARESDYLYKRHLVEFVDQPHIDQRPIDKNARTIYIGAEISNLHHLASQHFGRRTSQTTHYPTNRLDRRQTCYEPDRLPVEALELPPRAVVDQLLQAYFTHVNPGFPVVDEVLFLAQYRARDPHNPPSLLLLHSMLVIGAHVLYTDDAAKRMSAKALFFRRAKGLFDARFERNRDTIVQAALLLSWHTDGPEDVAANAWFWIGVAMRTATGLGMHRDADGSTVVPHNKRMWRRVWWLLFQCDVLLSLQYGRPQSIRLEECDVKALQPEDFQDCGAKTQVSYVMHSIELAIITSRMLESRFALSTSPYALAGSSSDERGSSRAATDALFRWSLDLPSDLSPKAGEAPSLWSAWLQIQYNTLLILLHRAPPRKPHMAPDHSDICSVASGCIVSLLQALGDAGGFKSLWISAVNPLFTVLIQMDIQVQRSNPLVAMPALMQYDGTVLLLRRFAEYWPNALPILHFFEHLRETKRSDRQSGSLKDPPISNPHKGSSRISRVTTSGLDRGCAAVLPTPAAARAPQTEQRDGLADCSQGPLTDNHDSTENLLRREMAASDAQTLVDISEAWHDWQDTHWQHIDIMDDFPFGF